ncbi:MAG: DUF2330 domain-containing protein [Microthrixaceae bacterium]
MRARRRSLQVMSAVAAAAFATAAAAGPAGACGGLVGENGTIQLTKTTTLAAYHNGVERYVTSFQFAGEGAEVGSIVPLPDVPSDVVRGGDWTLQRLAREVAPTAKAGASASEDAAVAAPTAQVLLETKIDALDITVLRGGGDEVGRWARDNGFLLTPDAPEMLDFYASRSQVFMAARFDASRAAALGQNAGDGTPIMITIPTDAPWVPLRILSLGVDGSRFIDADVFLLTDDRPGLLAGGPGLSLDRTEPASTQLLDDLRSDKGMEWVPKEMWFTYLRVATEARNLDYDLAISPDSKTLPTLLDTGVTAPEARPIVATADTARWPAAAGIGGALLLLAVLVRRDRQRGNGLAPA